MFLLFALATGALASNAGNRRCTCECLSNKSPVRGNTCFILVHSKFYVIHCLTYDLTRHIYILLIMIFCPSIFTQWSTKCKWNKCGACAQCSEKPPCADSCFTSSEPWWPDDYPNHKSLYPTSGYKCTSVAECLGCPACTGKPNILFILADDVGIGDIVSPKLPPLKNINMLKRKGMSFNDVHTAPLCAPSRYIILSGRLQFRGRFRTGASPLTLTLTHDSCPLKFRRSLAQK